MPPTYPWYDTFLPGVMIENSRTDVVTIKNRQDAKRWQTQYDELAPKVAQFASDFELFDLQGENPVRLSSFRGKKPVVLIFGSFT